jgi:hypothetical protein
MEAFFGIVLIILVILIIWWFFFEFLPNMLSPQLAREAYVVGKRQHFSGSGGQGDTSYYVTFEFLDGSRKEFGVDARQYAYLAERDKGTLHSKGDWFLEFDRHLKQVR